VREAVARASGEQATTFWCKAAAELAMRRAEAVEAFKRQGQQCTKRVKDWGVERLKVTWRRSREGLGIGDVSA
jgi:hypothetical protein